MASSDDLQNFIENLLTAYDPTIDLSPGSPAETQIVQPILDRFADDPFSVDIPTFLRDRLVQEFPDLAADNGGQLEDLFTNPMQLFLEPFKREIESVKINQSVINADLMADAEADALGANFFEDREAGAYSGGLVRLYFAAPVTVNVTTDKRTYTNDGLNFYPVENFKISTAQMLFNRQGNLYFMDITVQAENPGDQYNVSATDIANIDDVSGVVKVSNLSDFTDGSPREDNATYLGRIPEALTERSLVTERGIEARIPDLFPSVAALSIIGAGDPGMDRDILTGTSEGFLHLAGSATYYGEWLIISNLIYRDAGPAGDIVIQAGDTIRFKPTSSTTVYEAHVDTVVPATTLAASTEYILILDQTLPVTAPASGSFALLKAGFITISGVPDGISTSVQVPDGTVHLGGHADVFVRPNSDTTVQDSLPNITDDSPVVAVAGDGVAGLQISGSTGSPTNVVVSAGTAPIDFVAAGVQEGDVLVIETSALAGSYRILKVGDPNTHSLRLDTIFTQTQTQLRGRIVRNIHIDLVEPRIPKLPFNTGSVSDLSTTVGSNLFRMLSVNIQSFGAVVGDTIRVLDGPDAGDFTITGFDTVLGGQGPLVDRNAGASNANLRYEVFTPSPGLTLPLIRIKTIEILDSTNQGTGITVPYGDAVDVRPTCNFQGASNEVRVLDSQMFVFPDGTGTLSGLSNVAATPGAGVDARYSQEIQSFDGIYRAISTQNGGNPITHNEINLPPFLYNGVRNKLMAFTTRKDPNFTAYPSGDNRTSDVAEAKIGDSLTILDGPNQGSYLITDLRVLDMWSVTAAGHQKIALVEVDPPLPVDPVATMMNLIAAVTPGSAITGAQLLLAVSYSTDFFNASGFWALLQTRLQAVMTALSITISGGDLNALTKSLAFTGYSVGPSARGTIRTYFQDPVSAEFSSGINPTRFVDPLQPNHIFRLDPALPDAQILPESESQTPPSEWARNTSEQWFVNGGTADPNAFLSTGSAFVKRDVQEGDVFEFYPAINDFPSRDQMSSSWVCVTQAGSNVVTALLPRVPGHITPIEAGQLFFIDTGPDIGAYTITEVITDELPGGGANVNRPVVTFRIDQTMTHSTLGVPGNSAAAVRPAMPNDFSTGTVQTVSGQSQLYHTDMANAVSNTDWVSIYAVSDTTVEKFGDDVAYLGTFAVIAIGTDMTGPYAVLDRSPNFPDTSTTPAGAYPATANVFWIIHQAPTNAPVTTSLGGTALSDQFVRCRFYDSVSETRVITLPWTSGNPLIDHVPDVLSTDPSYLSSQEQVVFLDEEGNEDPISNASTYLAISNQSFYQHQAPYRVLREGVHRISSTAMALQRDGALYYVDLPAIGYGPQSEMNIPENTALVIKENATIEGYQLTVENNIFTFSDQEQVSITLPSSILPVGSTPGISNEIDLAGQTIQITYDNAPLVEELQRFFNSPLDRVVAANYLLRHFLPAYVYLDAAYVSGSATDVVAADLITYINTVPPSTNQLVASQVENIIVRRGATQVTLPITLIALVHDIDRKVRGLRSQNIIGAGDVPIFNGTYAQTYFIAGPDTSQISPRPDGEQVFLTKT
jgi:hypothetical protein